MLVFTQNSINIIVSDSLLERNGRVIGARRLLAITSDVLRMFFLGTWPAIPMLTTRYLQSKPDDKNFVKIPAVFARTGHYPTSYTVQYDANRKEYTIVLGDMVFLCFAWGSGLYFPGLAS